MALTDVKEIQINFLDQWLSNLGDDINFNNAKIIEEVPSLDQKLTNIDSVPIKYLEDSLRELVNNINKSFQEIEERLNRLEGGR